MAKKTSKIMEKAVTEDIAAPTWALKFRRPNDDPETYVIELANGWPYHVIPGDPIYDDVAAAAAEMGDELGQEDAPEPPPPTLPTASVVALAELNTEDGVVSGFDSACGIGFGFMLDIGVFWLFFTEPQPDNKYLPFVQSPGVYADVTAREADYLEVTVKDRSTNEPIIPMSLTITVQRTQ